MNSLTFLEAKSRIIQGNYTIFHICLNHLEKLNLPSDNDQKAFHVVPLLPFLLIKNHSEYSNWKRKQSYRIHSPTDFLILVSKLWPASIGSMTVGMLIWTSVSLASQTILKSSVEAPKSKILNNWPKIKWKQAYFNSLVL